MGLTNQAYNAKFADSSGNNEIQAALGALGINAAAEENGNDEKISVGLELLPRFRLLSDVPAAYWLRNNPNPKSLKHYLVTQVLNDETVDVYTRIIQSAPELADTSKVPYWPGVTRRRNTNYGQALLGFHLVPSHLLSRVK